MTLVLDASAAVELLLVTPRGRRVAEQLEGEDHFAPELLDTECVSALARLERASQVSTQDADAAVLALARLPLQRLSNVALTIDAWHLRSQIRTADGYYVACSRLLRAPLLTCDRRLTAANLLQVTVLLVQ